MKKNIPFITFIALLLVLGYLVLDNKNTLFKTKTLNENYSQGSGSVGQYNLPVARDSKNVGNVLIHYFFTGKLKEIKVSADGAEVIFLNADPSLPRLIVTSRTRVTKITPPYELNGRSIDINTLKPGDIIDISAELEINTGRWSVLDVFFATDRN